MKKYSILLLIILTCFLAHSQTIWNPDINGPYGGVINDIEVTSSGVLIAATQHNGMWRSDNNGSSWTKINTTDVTIHDIHFDPTTNTIYASVSGSNRLLKSTDMGFNFSTVTGLVGLPSTSTSFVNLVKTTPDGTIYYVTNAAASGVVYKSTDSGANFTNVGSFLTSVIDFEVNAIGFMVFVLGNNTVRVYNSGFTTFSLATPPVTPVFDISMSGTELLALTATGPYLSSNTGGTWTSIKGDLSPGLNFSGGIKHLPNNVGFVIFNTITGVNDVIYSTNSGTNWITNTNKYPDYKCAAFKLNPSVGPTAVDAFVGTNGSGILRASNTSWGSPWIASSNGIKALQPTDLAISIANSSNNYMAIATGTKGTYLTTHQPFAINNGNLSYLFQQAPIQISRLVAFGSGLYGYSPGQSGVARSVNNSVWNLLTTSYAFNFIVASPTLMYDISPPLLQASSDGFTWTPTNLTGTTLLGVTVRAAIDPTNNIIYVHNNNGLIYKIVISTGVVSQLSLSGVLDMDFVDGTLFALTSTTQLQKSTDGGSTFTVQGIPSSFASNRIWAFDRDNFVTRSSLANSSSLNSFNQNKVPQWSTRALNDVGTGVSVSDFVYTTAAVGIALTSNSVTHRSNIPLASPKAPVNLRIRSNSPSTPNFTYPQSGAFEFVFEDNDPIGNRFVLERSLDNITYDSVGNDVNPSGTVWKNITNLGDFDYPNLTQGTRYYYRVKAVNESGSSGYTNVVSDVLNSYCNSTIPDGRSWSAVTTADPGFTGNGAGPFIGTNIPIRQFGTDRFQIPAYRFGIIPPSVGPNVESLFNIQENCGKVNAFLSSQSTATGGFGNRLGSWDNNTKTLTIKWSTYSFTPFEATTVFTLNSQDPPPAEPTLTASIYSGTEAMLTWNTVNFAREYVLERKTGANPYTQVAVLGPTIQLYIDKNLTPSTIYDYRITARHNFGPSGSTVSSAVTTLAIATVQLANTLYRPIETDLNQNLDSQQGASWGDLDGDGDEDLLLGTFANPQGTQGQPISIFENIGNSQMKRKEVAGITDEAVSVVRAIGVMDFNNDGKVDIYVNWAQSGNDRVFINQGNWNFTRLLVNEVTNTVAQPVRENLAMVDFDKDSFIDFYIPTEEAGSSGQLALVGPNALIKNVSGSSVTQVTNNLIATNLINSRMAAFADYDNDGDQDLYASNDWGQGHLYNNNNGVFTRVTGLVFDTDNLNAVRTISWGDIDNDGDLDLYISADGNLGITNGSRRLYRNDFVGGVFNSFTIVSTSVLQTTAITGFSSAFGDLDNDGDLDLFTTGGPAGSGVSNVIFRNNGSGTFSVESSAELINNPVMQNSGVALADVDKDGFLEVFPAKIQSASTLPNLLFKPTYAATSARRWLEVKLIGSVSNKAAIGARITVTTAAITSPVQAARTQIREVAGMTGYGSQSSLIQHFGLQNSTTCTVTVRWPSGIVQTLSGVASNQLITIVEDNKGPAVVKFTPANDAKAVALNSTLSIKFDEVPIRVAGKKVSLFLASNMTTPVQEFDVIAGVLTDSTIVFTPAAAFTPNTLYKVVIDEGAFRDPYNNLGTYTSNIWQFTSLDVTAPVFGNPAVVFPALVSKGFSASTFKVNVTDNVKVDSVKMSYRGAGTSGAFTVLAGTFNNGTSQWDFPIQETIYNATGLEFFFTAKDPDKNTTRHPSANNLQSLFETTAPVINVVASPTLVAKGFGLQTFKVLATDNFGVTAVKMFHRNTLNGVNYTELTGTLDATVANQYNFSIAESAFNGNGLEYYFTATDASGNSIREPLANVNPPTLKMLIDNQAPTISAFAAPASLPKANTTFTVKVSDNLGVTSVVMRYRGITSKSFITSNPGVKNAAGDYDFTVSRDWIDNMGIEYYFRAVDASKNIGVSPDTTAATNKYYKSFLKLDGANAPKLSLIKGSTGASGYQIISVPLELANRNIADNFDELGTADKTAYRFLRYRSTPTLGWDEYPGGGLSLLNRGEGYFLNSLKAEEITLLDGAAPAVDQSNFFQMALKKGWNQIGNPYTVQIAWSDVLAFNNNPAGVGKLVKYDNGYNTNDPDGVIDPYKGGFVQVDNDVTLKIPFRGFTTGGRKITSGSDLNQPNWELPFTLTQQGLTYEVAMIGMNEEASLSKDNFDLPAVPRLNEFIDASFDHPEHFMKKFAQDVVPTAKEFTWDFTVASNLNGEATISWKNDALGDNNKELYLLDVSTQQLTNMRSNTFYVFDPAFSKTFRIFFGENLEKRISPTKLSIGRVYPNPTSGATVVSFSLPETQSIMNVSLEVVDLMGRKIATLAKGQLAPGFYSTEWDANASQVTDGLYLCKLMVTSGEGQEIVTEKIMVKR